ncbi:hypothetical protein VAS14_17486 [Photobacterium angustum S14]|uniref:Uncharacterized protein n=1 Tax=Photobacterium angustum (strain S14 / CCUG 15956) TaxID=314292 RepID=Q1ZP91_PHOAS|nr:hypothetical protein [Photobacterium angustum]EAS64069.1 hypothetical protein VAS14_17486 [Photobacterium angustum S14]
MDTLVKHATTFSPPVSTVAAILIARKTIKENKEIAKFSNV